jgi:hypothetical protein
LGAGLHEYQIDIEILLGIETFLHADVDRPENGRSRSNGPDGDGVNGVRGLREQCCGD